MGLSKREGFFLSIWLILLAPIAGVIQLWDYSVDSISNAHEVDYKKRMSTKPYWFKSLWHHTISTHTYENLPQHIKKYFYFDKMNWLYPWRKYGDVYRLRFPFPTYELIYKVEKAYAIAFGVPRGEDISENNKIQNILNDNHYWSSKNGYSHGYMSFENKYLNIQERRRWKIFCNSMKNSDFSDEAETEAMRMVNKRKYM
jgi:hypothetical protein